VSLFGRRAGGSLWSALAVAVAVALGSAAPARAADEIDRELTFATSLARFGLPYYGSRVIERLLVAHPDAAERAKPVKAELMLASGRLKEAEEAIRALNPADKNTQGAMLTLANAFYNAGQFDKTRSLYDDFFKRVQGKPADPAFYKTAAFQYGQILEHAGDPAGALKAYQHIVDLDSRDDAGRQALCEQAELCLTLADAATGSNAVQRLQQAEKIANTVLYQGLDMWYGRALISLANARERQGKVAQAQQALMNGMKILVEIERGIREEGGPNAAAAVMQVSPIPGARAALGNLHVHEGQDLVKAGQKDKARAAFGAALTEYVNVLKKYPKSPVAPDVAARTQDLLTKLQAMGSKVSLDLTPWLAQVNAPVFEPADQLFRAGKYQPAIEMYKKLLQQFSNNPGVPQALGNMMLGYAHLKQPDQAFAAASDLGAKHAADPRTPANILQLAKIYDDQGEAGEAAAVKVYYLYLQLFPKHERAPNVLYRLAYLRNQAKDPDTAVKLLQRIADDFPSDPLGAKAMSQLAWSYYAASNYDLAIKGFTNYIVTAQPSPDKAQAQFFLATAFRMSGRPHEAIDAFDELAGWLQKDRSAYARVATDLKKNDDLLEQAFFQRGSCFAAIKEPAAEVPASREKAIKALDEFAQRYPGSKLLAKALRTKGATYLELGRMKDAAQVFDELAAKYPHTDEGKSALYALAKSALEVRQIKQAEDALAKLVATADKFGPELFLSLGRDFSEAKLPADALKCFEAALLKLTDPKAPLREVAIFAKGKAQHAAGDYAGAVQTFTLLFKDYPVSGFFREGKFAFIDAARQTKQYALAESALADVMRQFADKPVIRNQADLELARLQFASGKKDAALASYQRVALLNDPSNADLAPLIEEAYREAIRLGMDLRHYADVITNCEQYEKSFPRGKYLEETRKERIEAKSKVSGG
jgi:outer membrane protein assembly factor BamD (BamD/ComL family)